MAPVGIRESGEPNSNKVASNVGDVLEQHIWLVPIKAYRGQLLKSIQNKNSEEKSLKNCNSFKLFIMINVDMSPKKIA